VALARQLWQATQADLDFTRLVFVDETGTNTAMTRSHGWGQKGKKLFAKAPPKCPLGTLDDIDLCCRTGSLRHLGPATSSVSNDRNDLPAVT
jgi:hypothetical protein